MRTSRNRKKKYYRWLSCLLAVCMLLSSANVSAIAAYALEDDVIVLGENVTAALDEGVLTISGSGATYDFAADETHPLYEARDSIQRVVIEDGITGLGDYMFYNCSELTGALDLPYSIVSIGDYAFSGDSTETAPSFTIINNQFVQADLEPDDDWQTTSPSALTVEEQASTPSAWDYVITRQTIGADIFYPGQIGAYSASQNNDSFRAAAEAAGYAAAVDWKLVSFSVNAADENENEITDNKEILVPVVVQGEERVVFLPDYQTTGLAALPEDYECTEWEEVFDDGSSGAFYAVNSYAPETVNEVKAVIDNKLTLDLKPTVIFDISKGDVVIGATYSGVLQNEAAINEDGTYKVTEAQHADTNIYAITGTTTAVKGEDGVITGDYTVTIDSGDNRNIIVLLDNVNIDVTGTGRVESAETKELGKAALEVKGSGSTYLVLKNGTTNTLISGLGRAGLEKEGQSTGLLWISCETNYNTAVSNNFNDNKMLADAMAAHNATACSGCGELTACATDNSDTNYQFYCGAGIGTRGYTPDEIVSKAESGSSADAKAGINALNNLTIAGGVIVAEGGGATMKGNSYVHAAGAAGIGSGAGPAVDYYGGGVDNLVILGGNVTGKGGASPGACIGGGYLSGLCNIWIYGGTIQATERIDEGKESAGKGAGIGAGGGGAGTGGVSPGHVYIYGGTITARSGDGAAIGGSASGSGGVGSNPANGTDGHVLIDGGDITAVTDGRGAAIGGGGSAYERATSGNDPRNANGGAGYVEISGGTVKAKSEKGADIGGGGCASILTDYESNGGKAEIKISGTANVEALTSGIGGGKAVVGPGGNATVTISGGTIKAASIGGGASVSGDGGTATVNIGGGLSDANGYADAKITIDGGSLYAKMSAIPRNKDNKQVYLNTISMFKGDGTYLSNEPITSWNIQDNGTTYAYGCTGVTTDFIGKLYLYLPKTAEIKELMTSEGTVNSNAMGGKGYFTVEGDAATDFVYINFPEDDRVTSYSYVNGAANPLSTGTIVTKMGIVEFMCKPQNDYGLTVYAADAGSHEMKELTPVEEGKPGGYDGYQYFKYNAQANTQLLFVTTSNNESRMSLDLRYHPVTINKGNVKLGAYTYNGNADSYYLTSSGIPTENYLTVAKDSAIYVDQLTVESASASVQLQNGADVAMTVSNYNNSLTSSGAAAISLQDGCELTLALAGKNSLKLNSNSSYAIGGSGNIIINRNGGYLTLKGDDGKRIGGQMLTVNQSLSSAPMPYSFTPVEGKLVGYLADGTTLCNADSVSGSSFKSCAVDCILPAGMESQPATEAITSNGIAITMPVVTEANKELKVLSVTQNGTELNEGHSFENSILTINTDHCYGMLEVVMKLSDTITYKATDYTAEYNGEAHTFKIEVRESPQDYIVSYRAGENGNWSDEPITRTDAGTETVYWKIEVEETKSMVEGFNQFTITQAHNDWISMLTCPSVAVDAKVNADAVPKFGQESMTITFYKADGTTPVTTVNGGVEDENELVKPTAAGRYYVQAVVPETDNYTGLTSDKIPFEISSTLTVVREGRKLNLVNGAPNTKVTIAPDGAYSVYYELSYNYTAGTVLTFTFSEALPKDTKLTLIDACDGHYPAFAYYVATGGEKEVAVDQFTKMGETSKFTTSADEKQKITYQLCVDFSGTAGASSHTMELHYGSSGQTKLGESAVVTVTGTSTAPGGSVAVSNVTGGIGQITTTATVSGATGSDNVLAVTLLDSEDKAVGFPAGSVIKIGDKSLEAVRGNFAAFSGIADGIYDITMTGLPPGSYKLQVSLCAQPKEPKYPMAAECSSQTSNVVIVAASTVDAVKATTDAGRVFGTNGGNITFDVKASGNGTVNLKVMKKADNSVVATQDITLDNQEATVTAKIPTNAGTYRYQFTYGDAKFDYYIIVDANRQ